MTTSLRSLATLLFLASTIAFAACSAAQPPRPAKETGGPAPTASTSAQVLFLSNQ